MRYMDSVNKVEPYYFTEKELNNSKKDIFEQGNFEIFYIRYSYADDDCTVSNISKIVLFKKGVDKRLILKLGIPAVIFVIMGAILTKHIPQKESELLMNIMLVFFAFFLVYKINSPLEQNDRNLIIGGISSGFLAGLIGTGGALRGLTLAAFNLPKNIYISTSAIIDLGVDLSWSIVYIYNGYFLTKYIIYIPFLILISVLGSWIGKIILTYISELYFKYIVIIIIIITCLFQVIKYFY